MDLMLLVADLKLQVADLIHEVAGLRMEVPELRPGEIRLNLTTVLTPKRFVLARNRVF